jgi:hypothetical protein
MNSSEIENILRNAPQPKPPAGLKPRLVAQTNFSRDAQPPQRSLRHSGLPAWIARWWPAIGPAAVSLACAAVLASRQLEIRGLQHALGPVAADSQAAGSPPAASASDSAPSSPALAASAPADDEIARLKELASKLTAEISRLEQIHAENQKLRAQLAAASGAVFTADETRAMDEARQRVLAIQCVNNLKQLGLAVRVWATDNGDVSPPDILSMTNEMNTPKILVCPAETGRQPAATWASFTAANCSYEYLAPSAPETEPERVLFRCPLHGNITLCDGSVQARVAKTHPEWFVLRDGKLYYHYTAPPPGAEPNRTSSQ